MSHFERVLSVSDRLIIAYHSHRPDYRQLFHTAPEEGLMSVNDLIFYEMDCSCSNNFRLNILWPRQFYDHCLDHIKHSTRYAGREQRIYFDCDICHQKFTDSVYYLHHLAAVHVKHVVRCHRCGHHCDRTIDITGDFVYRHICTPYYLNVDFAWMWLDNNEYLPREYLSRTYTYRGLGDQLNRCYHFPSPVDMYDMFYRAAEGMTLRSNELVLYQMSCLCSTSGEQKVLWPRDLYNHCHMHLLGALMGHTYYKCQMCAEVMGLAFEYLAHLANNHIQKVIRCSLCGHECVRGPNARYEHVCRPHDKHRLFDRIWRDIDDE